MITIETERVVVGSPIPQRKIIKIHGCKHKEELPDEYLKEAPNMYFYNGLHDGTISITGARTLYEGDTIPEEDFQKSISMMRKAARRLYDINHSDKIIALQKKWNGKESINI